MRSGPIGTLVNKVRNIFSDPKEREVREEYVRQATKDDFQHNGQVIEDSNDPRLNYSEHLGVGFPVLVVGVASVVFANHYLGETLYNLQETIFNTHSSNLEVIIGYGLVFAKALVTTFLYGVGGVSVDFGIENLVQE